MAIANRLVRPDRRGRSIGRHCSRPARILPGASLRRSGWLAASTVVIPHWSAAPPLPQMSRWPSGCGPCLKSSRESEFPLESAQSAWAPDLTRARVRGILPRPWSDRCVSFLPTSGESDTLTDHLRPFYLYETGRAGGLEGLASLVRGLLVDLLQNGLRGSLDQILASFRPRLVSERTSLITWIFLSPAASRMTSTSSLPSSSTGPASPPPAAGAAAAAATGAAAVTPKVVSNSFDELAELDQGQLLEGVKELCSAELRHGGRPS